MPLGTADRNHAGSGVQAGESAQQAGEPDEEPAVGAQLGDAAGECASLTCVRPPEASASHSLTYALVSECSATSDPPSPSLLRHTL